MTVDLSKPAFVGLLNHAASATITATSEAAGFDADNLKTPTYSTLWRSTSAVAQNLDFDLGAVKSDIEAIVIHGLNLQDAATVRILVDSNAGFPSPEHDSGTIAAFDASRTPAAGLDDTPPWGRALVYFPPITWAGRYVRVTQTDTTNPAGYLQAAYAEIGPVFQPGYGAIWKPGDEWHGEIGVSVARGGHTLGFIGVEADVRGKVLSLGRALQGVGRFTLVPQPAVPASWLREVILGRLRVPIEETPWGGMSLWDLNIQVVEVSD